MIERIEHIAQLLRKRASGTLNKQETAELQAWADEKEAHAALLQSSSSPDYLIDRLQAYRAIDIPAPNQLPQLKRVMTSESKAVRLFRRWLPYVAAVLLMVSVTSLYFWKNSEKKQPFTITEAIQPGGHKATLTLADGRIINLSTEQSGIVIGDAIRYQDGSLLVTSDPDNAMSVETPMAYAILKTPRGGMYALTLPDGTQVWLNAASTLKYPRRFDESERVVELEGEAYFEVKPAYTQNENRSTARKIPFLVKTKAQTVEVRGTRFNITAYDNEPVVKTTLVEGSVEIVNTASQAAYLLKPGMQSNVRGAQTTLHATDPLTATAWREGLIVLADADLPTVIRALERWYDVAFVGMDLPANIRMNGEVPRDVPLETVLHALELNTNMHFQIKGRRVVMTK